MISIYSYLLDHVANHIDLSHPIESVRISDGTPDPFIEQLSRRFLSPSATILKDSQASRSTLFDLVIYYCPLDEPVDSTDIIRLSRSITDGGQLLVVSRNPSDTKVATIDNNLRLGGLQPLFVEPVGKLSFIRGDNLELVPFVGKLFINSYSYSPLLVMIYRKQDNHIDYIPESSFNKRLKRIKFRTRVRLEKSTSGRFIIRGRHGVKHSLEKIRELTGVYDRRYTANILATIPKYPPTTTKTRVVIAMTWMIVGGVERVMLNIIKGLDKHLFEVHILTCLPSSHPWHDEFEKAGARITHVATIINEKWSSTYASRYVADYVVSVNADSLLITNSSPAYHALPHIRSRLSTCRTYDLLHTHGTPQEDDAFLKISMPFDQFIDRRIVIDKYLKDYYCKRYPIDPGRIDVIYNGISDESYGHAKELAARPRGPYSPQSRICIAYVGRLDTDKSTMRLIKIAKRCGDAKIPIKIEIYGDGPARHDMEQCARNYGILGSLVQFHGFVDSPLEVMAVADFTILTSNAEGIPMSVLESMSCGIPPIVPAVGGIPEMVRHGVDGFLCEISDVHDEDHKIEMFVDAITLAAHLEPGSYRDMQQNCQITVNDRFRSMHHDYSQLLQKATP